MKGWKRILRNPQDRVAVIGAVSLLLSGASACIKLFWGMYLFSAWFIINALYYLLLCAARWQALAYYREYQTLREPIRRLVLGRRVEGRTGLFVCLLGASYLLICFRLWFVEDSFESTGATVAGAAVISALKLGMAVYGALAARHNRNPIVKSLKRISLTDGLVSLAVTQYTLLELGRLSAGPQWAAAFGMGVGLLILWVGAGLVREGRLG